MVLEVFSDLELKVKKSVDYITLLKVEINDLQLKNQRLKEKLKNIYSLKERIEQNNLKIQEERMKWKKKIRLLLEKINDLE